jgi:hypothetical protein
VIVRALRADAYFHRIGMAMAGENRAGEMRIFRVLHAIIDRGMDQDLVRHGCSVPPWAGGRVGTTRAFQNGCVAVH